MKTEGEYLSCGHHKSLLIKSAESDYQYCDLCECRKMRNDAEEMERAHLKRAEESEAREAKLREDAERYRRVFQEPAIEWEVAGGCMAGIEVVRFTTNPYSDPDYETLNKETADAAIDAALKGEGK